MSDPEVTAPATASTDPAAQAPASDPAPAADPAGPADPRDAKITLLQAQLDESFARARDTQERLKEEHERLLRTAAEFENFKRRASKEKDDARKFSIESLLKDFLPVSDNLERALDHAEQHDPKQVIDGVRLVQKMFEQALGKHGLTAFSALGKQFDPSLHEALMNAESDQPPGTVVQEMARGYKLHDRLVRPAAVVVAKPRAAAEEAAAAPNDDAKADPPPQA